MKFVHIADMHFDSPFVNLSDDSLMGDIRRLAQRKVFQKVITYIKENQIPYLFIAGDLYEQSYIKQSTIEYINHLFEEIPDTCIFIAPGNHDPYLKNSYYNKFFWSENVKIFDHQIEKVALEDVNIYGFGFDDFYCSNAGIEDITIEDKDKPNILIIHGDLDGAKQEGREYNPLNRSVLEEKGFDYVALGHIHKTNYQTQENQRIIYPGSTVSLGFDEMGQHGMMVGEIEKDKINLDFVVLDEETFVEKELDVSAIEYKEDLIEKIAQLEISEQEYIKLILVGNRQFELNKYELLKLIQNKRIIKIKDNTKIAIDLKQLENETTLKGLFIKEMNQLLDNQTLSEEEREIIEKAIEIGIDALQ